MYDVIIIGAGVIGTAVARELSRYQLTTCVLEKEEDVCVGTSKANSGLVHAGFDAEPGTNKAVMNLRGNELMESLCVELDVPFKRTGALVLAFNNKEEIVLNNLLEKGKANGVLELSIFGKKELQKMEPNLEDGVIAGLYAKSAGIVCPFKLTIAMAENANVNGVKFSFDTRVTNITKKTDDKGTFYEIETMYAISQRRVFQTRTIINCAGVYSDIMHNMVSNKKYRIIPRRGQYCLLDKTAGEHVNTTIFKVPGPLGKGILVTPTVHGNLLIGPTAEDLEDKEAINTTAVGLEKVLALAKETVKNVPIKQVITSFSGLRAHEEGGDFIITEAEDAKGFVDAVGIESPGLTSAPAIGERLATIIVDILKPTLKANFTPYRKDIVHLRDLPVEQQKKLILEKPEYGTIICRCEMITEGEILDAIYRPLGAKSLDGIKRRTRAGMGRCQSGFCQSKIVEILAKALKIDPTHITKSGIGTRLLIGNDKEESI